jgi:hypothetical protein
MMRLISEASPEDRAFLENFLAGLRQKDRAQCEGIPCADDPFYRLHELATDDLKPLSNQEMDAIIYGRD